MSRETPKNYQPSPEEIKRAEEFMTPTQRELTERREAKTPERKRYQELGIEKLQENHFRLRDQGHEIFIKKSGGAYRASINNVELGGYGDSEGEKLAKRLWDKYAPLTLAGEAASQENREEEKLIKRATAEVQDQATQEIRRQELEKAHQLARNILGEET